MLSRLSLAPRNHDSDDDDSLKLHDGVSTETREITVVASPLRPVTSLTDRKPGAASAPDPKDADRIDSGTTQTQRAGLDELLGGATTPQAQTDRAASHSETAAEDKTSLDAGDHNTHKDTEAAIERQPSRPKRSSIPSWDEIVFGARGD